MCNQTSSYFEIAYYFDHFEEFLELKYETEEYIAFKTNKIRYIWFNKKWKVFEEGILSKQLR